MINLCEKVSLEGYRLVIPSTCVGNVSQLTCDLLIESLKMTKIANCFHSCIIPIIGPQAFSHIEDSVTTAAELYRDKATKLAVLQLRTPLAAPLMEAFFQELQCFVKAQKILEVHILTSSYGSEKRAIMGSSFWCKASGVEVPATIPQITESKILGGGFAIKLYQALVDTGISAVILFKFVSEGDNIPDAVELLQKFNGIVQVFDESVEFKIQMPVSWKYLFGNKAPQGIY